MAGRLDGQVAIITGASAGIGQAAARALMGRVQSEVDGAWRKEQS